MRSEDQVDATFDEERLKICLHLLHDPATSKSAAKVHLPVVRNRHPRGLGAVDF